MKKYVEIEFSFETEDINNKRDESVIKYKVDVIRHGIGDYSYTIYKSDGEDLFAFIEKIEWSTIDDVYSWIHQDLSQLLYHLFIRNRQVFVKRVKKNARYSQLSINDKGKIVLPKSIEDVLTWFIGELHLIQTRKRAKYD